MGLSAISAIIGLGILIFGIFLFKKEQLPKIAIVLMIVGAILLVAPAALIYLLLD